MNIGIIGLGFVGNAMYQSFKKKYINLKVYDKYKDSGIGKFEDILSTEILFLALPTPYDKETKQYDISALDETIGKLKKNNYSGIIVIKSTIIPGTIKKLEDKYDIGLIHNPEFLSAKSAEKDFENQSHIVLGKGDKISNLKVNDVYCFYNKHYAALITMCDAMESESMKIFCNSFYSIKIQFFTELYLLCQKNNTNFNVVRDMMLQNNWINKMHTNVPGNDGEISYGGLCFPKDTNALNSYMKSLEIPNKVLNGCIEERDEMRE